jgi:hypothetical protein
LVTILIRNHSADLKFDQEAIEYSYVYESDRGSPTSMAHGYVVVAGDVVLFVQHTSKHVNVLDGIYTYDGIQYSYTGTAWKKLGPTSRLQATPGSRLD